MTHRYLHVGAWNIEHFGKDDDRRENRYAIAEHLELAGVDILALQEIYITNAADFQGGAAGCNDHLDGAMALLREHTGHDWQYELFRNRSQNDTSQLCGVVWNGSKVEHRGTLRLDVPRTVDDDEFGELWIWDRVPHAVHFSAGDGKIDLAVIPVHMKSNVGVPAEVFRKREVEAATLLEQLPAVRDVY